MQTKEARQLAHILRLIAARLETDPRSFLDFLGQPPSPVARRHTTPATTTPLPPPSAPFKPLTLFHDSGKDPGTLRSFLASFTKADLVACWAAHPYGEKLSFPKSLAKGKIIDRITSFIASTDPRDTIVEML